MGLACVIACGASNPPDKASQPANAPAKAPQADEVPAWRIIGLEHYVPPPEKPADAAGGQAPAPTPASKDAAAERPRRKRPEEKVSPVHRGTPLPYPACPALVLSACLGQLQQTSGSAEDTLPLEKAKTPRLCEPDIHADADRLFSAEAETAPGGAGILRDHCGADSYKERAIGAAQGGLSLKAA